MLDNVFSVIGIDDTAMLGVWRRIVGGGGGGALSHIGGRGWGDEELGVVWTCMYPTCILVATIRSCFYVRVAT